jgi:glucose-6-phosphate 1-dehydrogenase
MGCAPSSHTHNPPGRIEQNEEIMEKNDASIVREEGRSDMMQKDSTCGYLGEALTVFVVGASGDLAKKKTYPSLYNLYRQGFLPNKTCICGYARSANTDEKFQERILPFLKGGSDTEKRSFLDILIYRNGAYDSAEDVGRVFKELKVIEDESGMERINRLFYFAIPPTVFVPIGKSLKEGVIGPQEKEGAKGWSRLIVEKPFGKFVVK